MEQLEATIEGTVFRNEENGYSVLTVRSGRSEVTVIGTLPELSPGEQAVFTGEWTEHRTYGRLIHGVGPSTATLIVSAFGEETLTILSEHPERLCEVRGIGPKRAAMIAESFLEQQSARRALIFLQSYGVSPALAVKISRHYGERTPEIVKENPYRLCDDLEGVGFKTADRIGLSLGIPPESENRVRARLSARGRAVQRLRRTAGRSPGSLPPGAPRPAGFRRPTLRNRRRGAPPRLPALFPLRGAGSRPDDPPPDDRPRAGQIRRRFPGHLLL